MIYILLKRVSVPGFKIGYSPILESDDFSKIDEKFKNQVKGGCPLNDLKIVQDIPFEFKCAIKLMNDYRQGDDI